MLFSHGYQVPSVCWEIASRGGDQCCIAAKRNRTIVEPIAKTIFNREGRFGCDQLLIDRIEQGGDFQRVGRVGQRRGGEGIEHAQLLHRGAAAQSRQRRHRTQLDIIFLQHKHQPKLAGDRIQRLAQALVGDLGVDGRLFAPRQQVVNRIRRLDPHARCVADLLQRIRQRRVFQSQFEGLIQLLIDECRSFLRENRRRQRKDETTDEHR